MINEIGTLRALPNGGSVFVGSSSGVFFINTVRRAFSHAAATASSRVPLPEECIFGQESHAEAEIGTGAPSDGDGPGDLPTHAVAKELLITYFRSWHPLLPFLHGPTCLNELEDLYACANDGNSHPRQQESLSTRIIFQCLFNIAKLDRPDLPQLGRSKIRSEEEMIVALSRLSLKCDLSSIQALLAAQLYFAATMSLHAASTTGGLILRSIFKSGLHRCPVRYADFNADDRDMRKRVFWSAYTLDRFMSQSLGHPLGIQDSDIDVCPPGKVELHETVFPRHNHTAEEGTSPEETILHLPANHPARTHKKPSNECNDQQPTVTESSGSDAGDTSGQRCRNQSVQAKFVRYSRLLGRMVEMFHKSLNTRSTSQREVLYLKADIDAWGNSLPYAGSANLNSTTGIDTKLGGLDQDVFFGVAQQQLLLLVNRPSLSLDTTSAEFRHAVQLCIGAARSIIRMLEAYFNSRGTLFWPGFMSAVWMSGLVLVFSCQLRMHSISNAITEISASLRILKAMIPRWSMAQNCHDVLSMLLESIQNPPAQSSAGTGTQRCGSECPHIPDQALGRGTKRAREAHSFDVSPEREHSRSRLSRQVAQAQRSTLAFCAGQSTQETPMTDFDNSQGRVLRYNPGSGQVDMNGQAISSSAIVDPLYFPAQHIPNLSGIYNDPTTSNRNDCNMPTHLTPGFDPTTHYDVFDGAMWGPLLELVEPNG